MSSNMSLFTEISEYRDGIKHRVHRLRRNLAKCDKAPEILSHDELGKLEILRGKMLKEVNRLETLFRVVSEDLRVTGSALAHEIVETENEPLYQPNRSSGGNLALMVDDRDGDTDEEEDYRPEVVEERRKASLKKMFLGWIETGRIT